MLRHRDENDPGLPQPRDAGGQLRHQPAAPAAAGRPLLRRRRPDHLDAPHRRRPGPLHRGDAPPLRRHAQGHLHHHVQAGVRRHRPQPRLPDGGPGLPAPDRLCPGDGGHRRPAVSPAGHQLPHRGPGRPRRPQPRRAAGAGQAGGLLPPERKAAAARPLPVRQGQRLPHRKRQPALPRGGAHDRKGGLCRRAVRGAAVRRPRPDGLLRRAGPAGLLRPRGQRRPPERPGLFVVPVVRQAVAPVRPQRHDHLRAAVCGGQGHPHRGQGPLLHLVQ